MNLTNYIWSIFLLLSFAEYCQLKKIQLQLTLHPSKRNWYRVFLNRKVCRFNIFPMPPWWALFFFGWNCAISVSAQGNYWNFLVDEEQTPKMGSPHSWIPQSWETYVARRNSTYLQTRCSRGCSTGRFFPGRPAEEEKTPCTNSFVVK